MRQGPQLNNYPDRNNKEGNYQGKRVRKRGQTAKLPGKHRPNLKPNTSNVPSGDHLYT